MKLEDQIAKLAELGLKLNDGITIDDFFVNVERHEYEEEPFDWIMFVYGDSIEQGDRKGLPFCNNAFNMTVDEFLTDGEYIEFVKRFFQAAGQPGDVSDIEGHVTVEDAKAYIKYPINGEQRTHEIVIDDYYAGQKTVYPLIQEFKQDGFDFYCKDAYFNLLWFYLSTEDAMDLNTLAGNAFKLKRPWWKIW